METVESSASELEAVRLELEQLRHEAGRMHYLGNLVRQRDQAEQDELTRLMRKHPPRLEATAVTPELGLAGPWKDLARRNAVAFRDAHDQLSRTETQLTTERARVEEADARYRANLKEIGDEYVRNLADANFRAEEAERQVDEWETRAGSLEAAANQAQRERDKALTGLAAANARVVRLEECVGAAKEMRSWYSKQMGPDGPEDAFDAAVEALSAAPQASTEQRKHNPRKPVWLKIGVHVRQENNPSGPWRVTDYDTLHEWAEVEGGKRIDWDELEFYAMTEVTPEPIATSPIPQVAQASALPNATARFVRPPKPDQCPGCGSYSEQERFDIEPGAGDWCQSAWHDADEAQASADRPVMLSELVAALRKAAAEYVSMGPAAMARGVADRLEGK